MTRLQILACAVEKTFAVRLTDRSRKQHITDARIVFAKVATQLRYKGNEIATALKRDHSTVVHYKKTILPKRLENLTRYIYEAMLTESEVIQAMAKRLQQTDYLTQNEKAYRRLSAAQKAIYDQRVEAILKML